MPEQQITFLSTLESLLWVYNGILISIFLPLAIRATKRDPALTEKVVDAERGTPTIGIRKAFIEYGGMSYVIALVGATLVATVIVFLLGLEFTTSRDAAIAGFAWESLVNKLIAAQSNPAP